MRIISNCFSLVLRSRAQSRKELRNRLKFASLATHDEKPAIQESIHSLPPYSLLSSPAMHASPWRLQVVVPVVHGQVVHPSEQALLLLVLTHPAGGTEQRLHPFL
mmetsp:Transcript_23547/g.33727  ORF Transcript_23547/g.33727 Transcript_23547/m.33727 type:complete len:105 (-) Transcript_23547:244-558(-)